jgi:hypothetical protein
MADERSRSLDRPASTAQISRGELASYVAGMAAELSLLTGRARWPMLTYFLNMARVEAESQLAMMEDQAPPSPAMSRARRKRA